MAFFLLVTADFLLLTFLFLSDSLLFASIAAVLRHHVSHTAITYALSGTPFALPSFIGMKIALLIPLPILLT